MICDFKKQLSGNKVELLYYQIENYGVISHTKNKQNDFFNVFVPTKLLLLYGDDEKISQMFYNLLNNAIKFTIKGFIVVEIKKCGTKKY